MTDKEFKRLSRAQLIDIIYQLQLRQKELETENETLKAQLDDKRLRMRQAGNIAEAALEINGVMQAAQRAADQYLEEIHRMRDATERACRKLLEETRQKTTASDDAVNAILKDY